MLCQPRRGLAAQQVVGLCHSVQDTRASWRELRRRAVRGGHVHWRRASTTRPGCCASSTTARTSTRCWTRAIAARPRAAPPGARRHVPPARLLPDRDQRALRGVRALVPARRRARSSAAHPGRRLRPPQRGQPRRVRATCAALARRRGAGPPERSTEYAPQVIHSMVTGHAARDLRQRANSGLITNLPAGVRVEVPCVVDGTGVRPTHRRDYPPQLRRAQPHVPQRRRPHRPRRARRRRAARAPRRDARPEHGGDARRSRQIDAVVDELLAAHAGALPAGLQDG